MKKLKDKLIRMLGGYTQEDLNLMLHQPVRYKTESYHLRTLKLNRLVRADAFSEYPDLEKHLRKDMAYMIGGKMLEDGLIKFGSEQEDPSLIKLTALVEVGVPEE